MGLKATVNMECERCYTDVDIDLESDDSGSSWDVSDELLAELGWVMIGVGRVLCSECAEVLEASR